MLIKYTVKNYKSIKDEIKFSMKAYMRDSRNKETIFNVSKSLNILPLASIYGQNASGKTNFIGSISFLRHLVVDSKNFERKDVIRLSNFAFDNDSRDKVTKFYIEFLNEE